MELGGYGNPIPYAATGELVDPEEGVEAVVRRAGAGGESPGYWSRGSERERRHHQQQCNRAMKMIGVEPNIGT